MNINALIIVLTFALIGGVIGGNIGGIFAKKLSFGPIGNTIAGTIGGALGGLIYWSLGAGTTASSLSIVHITALISTGLLNGAIFGCLVMQVAGIIKLMMNTQV